MSRCLFQCYYSSQANRAVAKKTQPHVLVTTKLGNLVTFETGALPENHHCTLTARKTKNIFRKQQLHIFTNNFSDWKIYQLKRMIIAHGGIPREVVHAVYFNGQKHSLKKTPYADNAPSNACAGIYYNVSAVRHKRTEGRKMESLRHTVIPNNHILSPALDWRDKALLLDTYSTYS